MRCPNCNFENDDNNRFCINCGERLYLHRNNTDPEFEAFKDNLKRLPGYDTFGTKKEIRHLYKILYSGEDVMAIASGIMNGNTWLVACTNIRIIFVDCGMIYGVSQSEILIDKVNSISYKNGLLLGTIYVQDGASTKTITNVQKYSTKPFVDAAYKAIDLSKKRTYSSPVNFSVADELTKLKSLVDSGIITEREFDEQKRKLLSM